MSEGGSRDRPIGSQHHLVSPGGISVLGGPQVWLHCLKYLFLCDLPRQLQHNLTVATVRRKWYQCCVGNVSMHMVGACDLAILSAHAEFGFNVTLPSYALWPRAPAGRSNSRSDVMRRGQHTSCLTTSPEQFAMPCRCLQGFRAQG